MQQTALINTAIIMLDIDVTEKDDILTAMAKN